MKKSFYIGSLLLVMSAAGFCGDDLQDNLPQYTLHREELLKTEEVAALELKRLEKMNDRYIKERPEKTKKFALEGLERIFRWYSSGVKVDDTTPAFQTYQVKLINQHPEWVPLILDGCRRPIFQAFSPGWEVRYDSETAVFQPQYFNSMEILPYHEGCTWEKCRLVYRMLLEQYRTARQYMNHSDWQMQRFDKVRYEQTELNPGASIQENYLRWMMRSIPGVLARFPTPEGVEELCQQMEAYPGWTTLAAANALSVCTSEETLPRVKGAFETAKRIRREIFPNQGDLFQMPMEYTRLAARLADVKADLTGMMEGSGFRLIKPDWSAAKDQTWNQIPLSASLSVKQPGPAVTTASGIKSPPWNWALLLLIPVTWLVRRAWDRYCIKGR
jgi:hypothetical protein